MLQNYFKFLGHHIDFIISVIKMLSTCIEAMENDTGINQDAGLGGNSPSELQPFDVAPST